MIETINVMPLMSSENLNINVNPLKEKSDKIEFTVDKMGFI